MTVCPGEGKASGSISRPPKEEGAFSRKVRAGYGATRPPEGMNTFSRKARKDRRGHRPAENTKAGEQEAISRKGRQGRKGRAVGPEPASQSSLKEAPLSENHLLQQRHRSAVLSLRERMEGPTTPAHPTHPEKKGHFLAKYAKDAKATARPGHEGRRHFHAKYAKDARPPPARGRLGDREGCSVRRRG